MRTIIFWSTQALKFRHQLPMVTQKEFRSIREKIVMKSYISIVALGLVGWGLASRPVPAATRAASFSVGATVQATCVVSATAMTIPAQGGRDGRVAVSVACSHSIPYSVDISVGSAKGTTLVPPGISHPGYASWNAALVSHSQKMDNPVHTVGAVGNLSSGTFAGETQFSAEQCIATGRYADTIAITVIY